MTKVKICGVREVTHALSAAEAGADFVGFILAPGRRQVSPEMAKEIVAALKGLEHPPLTVGVFVNAKAEEVNRIVRFAGLDMVQLSGDESWEYSLAIDRPITKVVHVPDYKSSRELMSHLELGRRTLGERPFIPLLDSGGSGAYGGTGEVFDWEVVGDIPEEFTAVVAGGLTPENVGELVRRTKPWGVDVSSGVETEGRKDSLKIRAFLEAVRQADQKI
ncbi:MAG: phosphoribosylanthranilate isomerase [Chloroflexota bacterium]